MRIKVPRFEKGNFVTTEERSKLMSKIKGKETKPEVELRRALWALGLRYRINVKTLPGKPDIVIRKHKLVVFVDGEFWHGYNWDVKKKKIRTNRDFWIPKIERNMQRDRENVADLELAGFTVLRFWEHEIKKELEKCIGAIVNAIHA